MAAAFNWRRLLRQARRTAIWPSQPARRLAVNRAYYGAFHVARGALRAGGMANGATRFHRQVWAAYAIPSAHAPDGRADLQAIAELGHWLQHERTRADYDGTPAWSANECRVVVRRAQELVARVDALSRQPTR